MATPPRASLGSTAGSPGSRPLLVHGKSGIIQTEEMLAEHIADILPGWSGVDRSTIVVQNVSAEGGGSVYKVSADGAMPPKVALHVWDEESDDILKERTTAAALVFASAGLGPKRLAHGGDWFVEPWEGSGEPEWTDEKLVEVAELVAKVHRISPEWYEGADVHRAGMSWLLVQGSSRKPGSGDGDVLNRLRLGRSRPCQGGAAPVAAGAGAFEAPLRARPRPPGEPPASSSAAAAPGLPSWVTVGRDAGSTDLRLRRCASTGA
ncbi:unnamed protein product [Prorocentrum cordatum]|uniref:Aminoglycoside phosphotransferase domain-containing protein n=1 Tax=Prorocentrum cordatum TaxID=2364126 RepID=A0ABN9PDJ5_9DINO|nr:unnamed protein product [Polarella glacialis]